MSADTYTVVATGSSVLVAGSQAMQLCLLCGVSGTNVIPLRVASDGTLFTSGL